MKKGAGELSGSFFLAVSTSVAIAEKSATFSAGESGCGFETIIIWVHTRHLKRAALPLIFEASILGSCLNASCT